MVGMTRERNYVIGFLLPPPIKKDSKERERERERERKEKETKGEAIKEEEASLSLNAFTLFFFYLSKPSYDNWFQYT